MLDIRPPAPPLAVQVVEDAAALASCVLSDAMGGTGTMNASIKPLFAGARVAGTAYTVDIKPGNFRAVFAAVAMARKGHVIIVSAKGDTSEAVFGDMLTKTAVRAGASGMVIDGAARDVAAIREAGFPVFAITATACVGERQGPGVLNGPVSCGGVAVESGDLVVGDENGVVVVPRARIEAVFATARANAAAEEKRDQEIANGQLMPSWLQKELAAETQGR